MIQRVAIITGASSGIGTAVARQAVQRGYAVALTARREERLLALVGEIEAAGGRAVAVAGDITDLEDQRRIVAATLQAFGRIDILLNNAGVPVPTDFRDTPPEEIRRQWETNVTSLATLTRIALEELELRQGTVINVGSSISRVAVPRWGNYAPTKIAVAAISRALRRELQPRGVHVCLVEPGPIRTEFWERAGGQGDGRSWGITAEACARPIVRLFERPRKRIVVPGWLALPLRLMGAVETTMPGMIDLGYWLMYRSEQLRRISR